MYYSFELNSSVFEEKRLNRFQFMFVTSLTMKNVVIKTMKILRDFQISKVSKMYSLLSRTNFLSKWITQL